MRLEKTMKKIERFCLYLIPCSYIIIDIMSSFIPKLANIIDIKGYLIILSCQVVLFFSYFDGKYQSQSMFTRSEKIVHELVSLIDKTHFSDVEILAVNGYHYHRAIKESNCKIDKLTLLLRAPSPPTMILPTEDDQKQTLAESTIQLVERWTELQDSGQISELCIEYYDFDTTIHFMLLDRSVLFWGLLYPIKKFPGTEVLPVYTVRALSIEGEKMIEDFCKKMEMMRLITVKHIFEKEHCL